MKKYTILIILLFSIIPIVSRGQLILTIEINGLRSSEGRILLEVYDENKNKINGVIKGIENNKCSIMINNLKPGNYAFRYFHDENDNDELETNWMGMPIEGFGFSNNATGTFGPPAFTKWIFTLNDNRKLICIPKYL